ncbi:efflux RND transporter periplasmic adaptor subunit [Patescibacteria group bacterium]|nr:efflux RND transporter periplasmic adaptor subunit [Patescibacteria group bacterium]
MKKRTLIPAALIGLFALAAMLFWRAFLLQSTRARIPQTTTTTVRFVSSAITADGEVTAQDRAILRFQTAGKLGSLPFHEGDTVKAGQTVASLDPYALRRQLALAANTYEATKNTADQALENNKAGVLEGQERYTLDTTGRQGYGAIPEATVIYDAVKRIVDNDLLAQNSAQINVDLANYALQLAVLTSPISGIITHEDVTVPGVNVTTSTAFVVADPTTMVFRADIPADEIYYVSEGSAVTLSIDGIPQKLAGILERIYPSKLVVGGQPVYQADIQSGDLKQYAKLDEAGAAVISTNARHVALVPAWTVLGGSYVWIESRGTPKLIPVTAGKIHGTEIEITAGLREGDRVITDPSFISSQRYTSL